MINKLNLVDNIEKYHLSGIVDSVKWNVVDGNLLINFVSPNQDLVGVVSCDIELEDGTVGVFNTNGLLKMLNILDNDILINIEKQYKVPTKLLIEDSNYSVQYTLADPYVIQTAPTVNEPEYDVTFRIDSEFISRFSKAKGALGSNVKDVFRISGNTSQDGNKEVKLILGEPTSHANKIEFTALAEYEVPLIPKSYPFNSAYVKEILNANKNKIIEAKGSLSFEGILKLEFKTEIGTAIYFLPEIQI